VKVSKSIKWDMGMPTVLIDLITIYDDEEGSEASCITPVPITQEEEPGETSAPASDVLIPNPQEGDHEARNTLDTEFLDQLGTQPQNDSSKNDLGAGEQEEEMQQPKIDISTVELPANVDPLPTSPSRTKTPSADEDQYKGQITRTYRSFPC
jgi:hypothetical protein